MRARATQADPGYVPSQYPERSAQVPGVPFIGSAPSQWSLEYRSSASHSASLARLATHWLPPALNSQFNPSAQSKSQGSPSPGSSSQVPSSPSLAPWQYPVLHSVSSLHASPASTSGSMI